MKTRLVVILASAIVLSAAASPISSTAAYALTPKECSAKYQEAKKAGTLGGKSWNDFRKTECAARTKVPSPATTAAPAPPQPASAPAAPPTTGPAVFPKAIAQRYASESPGKARMHTCLAQYKTNKAANANGRLQWIQKGGGYYAECDRHLRGG
jgi:hypothetical protein